MSFSMYDQMKLRTEVYLRQVRDCELPKTRQEFTDALSRAHLTGALNGAEISIFSMSKNLVDAKADMNVFEPRKDKSPQLELFQQGVS